MSRATCTTQSGAHVAYDDDDDGGNPRFYYVYLGCAIEAIRDIRMRRYLYVSTSYGHVPTRARTARGDRLLIRRVSLSTEDARRAEEIGDEDDEDEEEEERRARGGPGDYVRPEERGGNLFSSRRGM